MEAGGQLSLSGVRQWIPGRWTPRRWGRWLALWTAVGLAIRIGAVAGRPHRIAGGDAYYYHNAANLLVEGKGWINPFLYYGHHLSVKTASFPPGFVLLLAAASVVGFKSYFAHRIWSAVIGAAAVAVCGWTGKEIAGPRVGLLTAFVIAVYPNIWMSDEMAMSETVTPLVVALVLWTAYRFWRRPGWRTGAWAGLALGVASLCRDELTVLGVLILVPLTLTATALSWRMRLLCLGTAAATALLVVMPWVGYNLSRFEKPVFISSGLGPTLASTDCQDTFYGRGEGYWSMECALAAPTRPGHDESVQAAAEQTYALDYVKSHEDRLVPVLAAKVGRGFGLFHPLQQIHLDSLIETRPLHWALTGLWAYYTLVAISVAGVVRLRRDRIPVFPLAAVGAGVVLSMILSFGDTRYRTAFEVSLAILGAVAVDWAWTAVAGRRAAGIPAGPAAADEPAPVGAAAGP